MNGFPPGNLAIIDLRHSASTCGYRKDHQVTAHSRESLYEFDLNLAAGSDWIALLRLNA